MIDSIGRIRDIAVPKLLHSASRSGQNIGAGEIEITSGNQYTSRESQYVRIELICSGVNSGGGPAKLSPRVVINDGTDRESSYDKEVELGSALTGIRWLSDRAYKMDSGDVMEVWILSDDAGDNNATIACKIYKANA